MNPIIDIQNLDVAYGDNVVLESIDLQVQAGEFLAVIGPNGSGKTTLMRTILGLVDPLRGQVYVFGQQPGALGALRSRIGYVPQLMTVNFQFPVRVSDVVLMGRYGKLGLFHRPGRTDREATRRALEQVGMAELANRQIGQLSGGQRQRVIVARALVSNPDLLILDEPTTGTDAESTESLYELLHRLNDEEHLTIVLVSHDVGIVAQHVDIVACLNRRLVAHGRPAEILNSETLSCMYGDEAMLFGHGAIPHMIVERR
ncbi:MAG: metal ABC transporter ATP-binding protein [Chloroflexi bacterium]|nr:metal ABC transporter ATP-binding protein [Chloroflexota bacterium]